jgi:protein-S-isoprenylcysteine O-methyltransferase Ste14
MFARFFLERRTDMLGTILIVILVLMLLGSVGTLPAWPHSRSWGYGPSGGLGLIVVILIILLLLRPF